MITLRHAFKFALLASVMGSAPAFAQAADSTASTTSGDVQIFPPANFATGAGLLAFPPGSNNSYYAVPVLNDPSLAAAINNQTTAVTGALNNLSIASSNTGSSSGGEFQTICLQAPVNANQPGELPPGCYITNTKTGVVYYNQLQLQGGHAMNPWLQVTNEAPAPAGNACSGIPSSGAADSALINYYPGQTYTSAENIIVQNPMYFSTVVTGDPMKDNQTLLFNIPSGCTWTCGSNAQWSQTPTLSYSLGQKYAFTYNGSGRGLMPILQLYCNDPRGNYSVYRL